MRLSRNLVILIVTIILLIALPVTIYLVKQQQTLKSKATGGSVTFNFNTTSTNFNHDDTFSVPLIVAAGSDTITRVNATVTYDSTKLDLLTFTAGTGLNVLVTPVNPNQPTSTPGTFILEAFNLNDQTGDVSVGTLNFKVKPITTPTTTQLAFNPSGLSAANPSGVLQSVPGSTLALNINGGTASPSPSGSLEPLPSGNFPASCMTMYNMIRAGFGSQCGDVNYDKRADINKSRAVTLLDYDLLRGNIDNASICQGYLDDPRDPCASASPSPLPSSSPVTSSTPTTLQISSITATPTSPEGGQAFEVKAHVTHPPLSVTAQQFAVFFTLHRASDNSTQGFSALRMTTPSATGAVDVIVNPTIPVAGTYFARVCVAYDGTSVDDGLAVDTDSPNQCRHSANIIVTAPPPPPTINKITVNLFYDYNLSDPTASTSRNGIKDAGELVPPIQADKITLSGGPEGGLYTGQTSGDTNNVVTAAKVFKTVTSGTYTVAVNLDYYGNEFEVTNPSALQVILPPGQDKTVSVGLAPKQNTTFINPTALYTTTNLPPSMNVGTGPYELLAGSGTIGNLNSSVPLQKMQAWRVRASEANKSDRSKWHLIAEADCNFNTSCLLDSTPQPNQLPNYGNPNVWIPNANDGGNWYVFLEAYDFVGKKCSGAVGKPGFGNMAGFTDCSGNDFTQVEIIAPLPNKVRVINSATSTGCNWTVNNSANIFDYPTLGNIFAQLDNWNITQGLSGSGFGQKFICAQFGYQPAGSSTINWTMFPNIVTQTINYQAPANSSPSPSPSSSPSASGTVASASPSPSASATLGCTPKPNGDADGDGHPTVLKADGTQGDFFIWKNAYLGTYDVRADFDCNGHVEVLVQDGPRAGLQGDFFIWKNAYLAAP